MLLLGENSEKKSQEFASNGSKFFPFTVDPFSKVDLCAEKQTGSFKFATIVKKMAENLQSISRLLKIPNVLSTK